VPFVSDTPLRLEWPLTVYSAAGGIPGGIGVGCVAVGPDSVSDDATVVDVVGVDELSTCGVGGF
jgi:hypothetical protein